MIPQVRGSVAAGGGGGAGAAGAGPSGVEVSTSGAEEAPPPTRRITAWRAPPAGAQPWGRVVACRAGPTAAAAAPWGPNAPCGGGGGASLRPPADDTLVVGQSVMVQFLSKRAVGVVTTVFGGARPWWFVAHFASDGTDFTVTLGHGRSGHLHTPLCALVILHFKTNMVARRCPRLGDARQVPVPHPPGRCSGSGSAGGGTGGETVACGGGGGGGGKRK